MKTNKPEKNQTPEAEGRSASSSVVRSITLWMEGYSATGDRAPASCLGTYNATDLDDAVKQYIADNPNSVDWDRFGRGRHAIWACEIFDNERQARKSFG